MGSNLEDRSFAHFDSDGDGALSSSEAYTYFKTIHPDWSESDLQTASQHGISAEIVGTNSAASKDYDRKLNASPLDPYVDPGKADRDEAKHQQDLAANDWKSLGTHQPTAEQLTIDPDSVKQYETGAPLDYSDAIGALWDPGKQGSAYDSVNHSVADFDLDGKYAANDALDYYSDLIANGGHDAVSDAAYEGKRADAEQAARAQREAALQNLNERGMGNGGSALQAELAAARDVGTNAHSAALEAAGLSQARMDVANNNRGTLGTNLYKTDADIGLRSAEDADKFGLDKAKGQDDWHQVLGDWNERLGNKKADFLGNADTANTSRGWNMLDKNTEGSNKVTFYNAGVPQQVFNNAEAVVRGKTGQANTATQTYLDTSKLTPNPTVDAIKFTANAAENLGKASATGKPPTDDDEDDK